MAVRREQPTSTCATMARIFGLPTAVLRMSCIAGPRQFGNEDQGWVAHFLYSALRAAAGRDLWRWPPGARRALRLRPAAHLRSGAAAASPRPRGEMYNVGGGTKNTVSLLELIAQIEELTGQRLQYRLDEPRPGDQLVYVTDYRQTAAPDRAGSRITVCAQVLELIYQWWRQQPRGDDARRHARSRAPAGSRLRERRHEIRAASIRTGTFAARPTSAARSRIIRWSYCLPSTRFARPGTNRC